MTTPAHFDETAECDLHDLTVEAAMDKFVSHYNKTVAVGRAQPIDVIHGFNQGIAIQISLRAFLTEQSDKVWFEIGERIDDNPGHTKVYPKETLPEWQESLAARIVAFCVQPKPTERISAKFRALR